MPVCRVIHRPPGCGRTAVVLKDAPVFGTVLDAAHVAEPAGLSNGDRMICMSCSNPFQPSDVEPERWKTRTYIAAGVEA